MLLFISTAYADTPSGDGPPLSCSINSHIITVHLAGTATGERNPRHMGIGSDGSFAYLNDPSIPAHFTNYDISTKTLEIDVKKQMAIRYHNGRPIEEKAFSRPGRYRLLFADNLETEAGNTFSLDCPIRIGRANLR